MKRTTRSLLTGVMSTLTICLVLAGVGTYYLYNWVIPERTAALEASLKADLFSGGVEAFVLTADVLRGEAINQEKLKRIPLPQGLSGAFIFSDMQAQSQLVASRDLKTGMILYQDMLYNPTTLSSDLRIYEIKEAVMPVGIQCGDRVDVRISFPTGLDYVVLSKKEVHGLIRDRNEVGVEDSTTGTMPAKMMRLHLNAEEILRYSSAMVDAFFTPGTYLYVTQYVAPDLQAEAVVNYPCNEAVQRLLLEDPNIVNRAKDALAIKQREQLNTSLLILDSNQVRPKPQDALGNSALTVEESPPSLSDLDN